METIELHERAITVLEHIRFYDRIIPEYKEQNNKPYWEELMRKSWNRKSGGVSISRLPSGRPRTTLHRVR